MNRTHGLSGTPEWVVWQGMKRRCLASSDPEYKNYGARGISVCEEWQHDFLAFLADVGPRPSLKYTLDRINNDGHYERGNVRWATAKEQRRTSRQNVWLEHDGERLTIGEWAARTGITATGIKRRLNAGWSVERALDPVRHWTHGCAAPHNVKAYWK